MTETPYEIRFGGLARLYGRDGLARLGAARVAVVGIGGVGSWAAEALARSGVGTLRLIDLDEVCATNTNRQLHALTPTVGRSKVAVMAERLMLINPELVIEAHEAFFTEASAEALVTSDVDWVVDAIDGPHNKCQLILRCKALGVPLVVVGGAGGRRDPTAVRVEDLAQTAGDGLLRRVRKVLKQKHGFPRRGRWKIPAVVSAEPQVYPTADGAVCEQKSQSATLRLDCESGYGTASFVTGAFGLAAASAVVGAIARTPRETA